jgi:magnesium transporter
MIRSIVFNPENNSVSFGGIEQVEIWKQNSALVLWLDIDDEDAELERSILTDFGIHQLAIQDALRQRHPPKLESFNDYLFILLKGLDAKTEGIQFGVIQLALFIGKRFLITRHNKASLSANWLFDQIKTDHTNVEMNPGALAIKLSGRLVRRYVQILLDLEPRLDDIEDEMFKKPNDRLLSELTGYKSRLRHLARTSNYHQHIVQKLQREKSPFIAESLGHDIVDLYEQVERSQSLAALYYEVARDLTDGYLAMSSHRLNNVMQILTVFTVIFVPLTFLAGVYGMNFQNMPELSSSAGYFVVLSVMLVSAIGQFFYFRRKGWI